MERRDEAREGKRRRTEDFFHQTLLCLFPEAVNGNVQFQFRTDFKMPATRSTSSGVL
jgi:hypothetical protein